MNFEEELKDRINKERFGEKFPSLINKEHLQLLNKGYNVGRTGYVLAHKDEIEEEHDVFSITVIRKSDIEKYCLDKQKVKEAIEKLEKCFPDDCSKIKGLHLQIFWSVKMKIKEELELE